MAHCEIVAQICNNANLSLYCGSSGIQITDHQVLLAGVERASNKLTVMTDLIDRARILKRTDRQQALSLYLLKEIYYFER